MSCPEELVNKSMLVFAVVVVVVVLVVVDVNQKEHFF